MNKILAGITTYNPNVERLRCNIEGIHNQVGHVLVFDNCSKNISDIKNLVKQFQNVTLLCNAENKGIAYAMNKIGSYAVENNYGWFLTLDQDSVCSSSFIEEASKHFHPSVGIIAPNIKFNKSFIKQLLHIDHEENNKVSLPEYEEVKDVISSGQLINTEKWKSIGGFWDFLFIDYVDHELCLNMTRHGFKIIRLNNLFMSHEPGIPIKVLGIETAKQSPMREYYWARNSRLVYWLYQDEYLNALKHYPFISTLKRIGNSFLVGENIWDKIVAIYYGVKDAHSWKKEYFGDGCRNPKYILNKRRY